VDAFEEQGLQVFGPSQKAAELEGSKVFTKYLLDKYKIPTAKYEIFDRFDDASKHLGRTDFPTVVKADGLAAGKGAIVCQNKEQAESALKRIMLNKEFGDAGRKVVIEEFMRGEEASILALTDGERFVYLPSAQDHKALYDNDEGPNTGGMGAYAPAPIIDEEMYARIRAEIVEPTIKALAKEDRVYRGVLYAGLMITESGPKVVEYNCRFGDPEAQVVLPLVDGDLVNIMFRIATRKRFDTDIRIKNRWGICVVIASGGYPGKYEKGKTILGLDKDLGEDVTVFHAGTSRGANGHVLTNGGRVLGVTALADDFYSARTAVYSAVGKIAFDNAYYRKDIGEKAKRYLRK
jgi:phosphoribosylamine--glycine ligase